MIYWLVFYARSCPLKLVYERGHQYSVMWGFVCQIQQEYIAYVSQTILMVDLDEYDLFYLRRHSLQVVELSHLFWQAAVYILSNLPNPEMGARLPFFGQAVHVDPLDGWRCSS